MSEVGVNRTAQYLATGLLELFSLGREVQNLGRANERKVEWVEEQQKVLVLVVVQGHFSEGLTWRTPSHGLEVRSGFADERLEGLSSHKYDIISGYCERD